MPIQVWEVIDAYLAIHAGICAAAHLNVQETGALYG
jgi:hypothetical protein